MPALASNFLVFVKIQYERGHLRDEHDRASRGVAHCLDVRVTTVDMRDWLELDGEFVEWGVGRGFQVEGWQRTDVHKGWPVLLSCVVYYVWLEEL